jgi:hypothetical protein
MKKPVLQMLVIAAALLVVPSVSAQVGTIGEGQLVLEAPAQNMQALKKCDYLHQLRTCDIWHYTPAAVAAGSALETGDVVYLNDQPFVLEWHGPGYNLDDGTIVEPLPSAGNGLAGQRWIEVYPNEGRIHTSRSWSDVDGNGVLNRFDRIELDSGGFAVEDVRLHLRVRPASR